MKNKLQIGEFLETWVEGGQFPTKKDKYNLKQTQSSEELAPNLKKEESEAKSFNELLNYKLLL